jgi:DNA-3-methyladenine glycosylase I
MPSHISPWECSFAKENEGECEPGKKLGNDQEYFEILCLCILQAGLNWGFIRKIWPKLKKEFYNFDINKLANSEINELLKRPEVIKNVAKVTAIIENARTFERIQKHHGSFQNFLGSLKGKKKEAINILTKRFRHLGEYSSEYFLHSVGY